MVRNMKQKRLQLFVLTVKKQWWIALKSAMKKEDWNTVKTWGDCRKKNNMEIRRH
jgi:hypothetical protein